MKFELIILALLFICLSCSHSDKSEIDCYNIDDEMEQAKCFFQEAIQAQDESLCLAIKYEIPENADVNIHNGAPPTTTSTIRDACLMEVAKQNLDYELCSLISYVGYRDVCFLDIAVQLKDADECTLNQKYYANFCLRKKAIDNLDPKLCTQITDDYWREVCLFNLLSHEVYEACDYFPENYDDLTVKQISPKRFTDICGSGND